jgi:hypothetical protein
MIYFRALKQESEQARGADVSHGDLLRHNERAGMTYWDVEVVPTFLEQRVLDLFEAWQAGR